MNDMKSIQVEVLHEFPLPIAANYQRILDFSGWEKKMRQLVLSFEFTVRGLALMLVSQYLLVDRDKVSDSRLNILLKEKLPKPSLGVWVEIVFATVAAYKDHRDFMFIPELHDSYWDLKKERPRKGVREPFDQLVVIRNRLVHELPPQDDAGWKILFEESHELLLQVFESLRFITNYNLLFITGQDDMGYQYQIYRGQAIKQAELPISQNANVGEGWFYLASGEGKNLRLLKLYPFLIAWGQDIDRSIEGIQGDAALLDKFSSSQIHYLATVLWESFIRRDEELLADFFYNYEKSLGSKVKARQLSWTVLKETTRDIVEQNMGDAIKKYNPQLYLEREEVRSVFESFLGSDKTCLAITGKSGVGKTNFVMAAIRAFQSDEKVCALAYNGARLPSDSSLSDLFRFDLVTRLELSPQMARGNADVWGILSNVSDVIEKKVVVFVDAINENPQASEVLRRLDQLIGSNPYPWLKFVITSRPEAWRVMNRRIHLAEHRYYWRPGEDEMGVELQEFSQTNPASLTISIDKFSRNEGELAYGKYQTVFGLKTEYKKLGLEIRQALQDPLILRLVAEIYKNNSIPSTLRVNQVYADFVAALVTSRRLYPEDVIFLQGNLIPRMTAKLDNALSEDEILVDKTLYEVIFNTDVLSSGRHVNQSYASLVDAEILASPSQNGPISITFKYERFFDYFMGEYYYKKYHNSPDVQDRYQELAETIRMRPFLWGAVKNALISELDAGQDELLYKLACQPDQAVRELVIAVLTEYGQGRSDQSVVLRLTKLLLAVHRERLGVWGRLQEYLPGKPVERIDQVGRGAAMTALEVARRLRLADVLEDAVHDPSQHVRVIAMRNIYHYWRMDPTLGFELLERLAEQVMTRVGFPRVPVLEACLGVTMLVIGHYDHQDKQGREIGLRLLSIWRGIIRRLLFVSGAETAGKKVLRSAVRSLFINIIIRFIVSTQESLPNIRRSFLGDVGLFFTSDQIVKARYKRFVEFLSQPSTVEVIKADFLDAVDANDALTSSLLWFILIPQSNKEFDATINLLIEIAQKDLSKQTTGLYAAPAVTGLAYIVTRQSHIDDKLFELSKHQLMKYLDKTRGIFYSNKGIPHNNPALGEYVILLNRRRNPEDENLSAHYLKIALLEGDTEFLERILLDIPVLASVFHGPQYALDAIAQLFPLPDDSDLIEKIISALAKTRSYYPEMVDEFLLDIDGGDKIFDKVMRQESKEQPWVDLLQVSIGPTTIKLIQTPEVRIELARILSLAVEHQNLKIFLRKSISQSLNTIAGTDILDLK